MLSPPRDASVWKTPLFEQYWRLKDSVPECLLFFRLGDFYELFGEDAVVAAPLLEVQLTSRDCSSASPVPMCGVPAHAVDAYAERLLARGHRVALAEQTESPAEAKGKLVGRAIVRILTPGLPVDFGRLDAREPHWFEHGRRPVRMSEVVGHPVGVRRVDLVFGDLRGVLALIVLLIGALYALQNRILFFPEVLSADFEFQFPERFREGTVELSGRERIHYLVFTPGSPKGAILYFHGNVGSLRSWGYAAYAEEALKLAELATLVVHQISSETLETISPVG